MNDIQTIDTYLIKSENKEALFTYRSLVSRIKGNILEKSNTIYLDSDTEIEEKATSSPILNSIKNLLDRNEEIIHD